MALTSPKLARSFITFAAEASDRQALLGDLEEEFSQRSKNSTKEARRWYWRQTTQSVPHLFLKRLRSDSFRKFGIVLTAIAGAFCLMTVWDMLIARNAARSYQAITNAETYTLARTVYLLVQMLGVALAGGVLAIFTFRPHCSFLSNVFTRLSPAALILFAPALINLVSPKPTYDLSFQLLWLSLAAPSLISGAACAMWIKSRRAP